MRKLHEISARMSKRAEKIITGGGWHRTSMTPLRPNPLVEQAAIDKRERRRLRNIEWLRSGGAPWSGA